MTEEWMQYHSLQPSYNEFEFRNSQVCLMFFEGELVGGQGGGQEPGNKGGGEVYGRWEKRGQEVGFPR